MICEPISTKVHRKPDAIPSPGQAPIQQWIEIGLLRVDLAYQRPIRRAGVRNVQKIAESFSWAKFAPVVVAPIDGGLFAIVDGQHRTTAAALIGIERVPCHIIQADPGQQAAAFHAINGVVTPMFSGALWHAKREAGEADAVALATVLAAAEVSICRYPIPADKMSPGQTLAVGALESCLKRYGRDTLITALQCVTQTNDGGNIGLLRAAVIHAICKVLHGEPAWRDAGAVLLDAFDDIDIEGLVDTLSSRRAVSGVLSDRLADAITEHLGEALPLSAVAGAA